MKAKLLIALCFSLASFTVNASQPSANEALMAISGTKSAEISRFSQMAIRYFTDINYKTLDSSLNNIERVSTRQLYSAYRKQFSSISTKRELSAQEKISKAIKIGSVYERRETHVRTVLIPLEIKLSSLNATPRIDKKVAKLAIVKTRYGLRVASFSFID